MSYQFGKRFPVAVEQQLRGALAAAALLLKIRPLSPIWIGVSSSRRATVLRNFARCLVGCPTTSSLWIAAAGRARDAGATRIGLARGGG
jgi:hypothetical protein